MNPTPQVKKITAELLSKYKAKIAELVAKKHVTIKEFTEDLTKKKITKLRNDLKSD